jgi:hypothetical protein
MTKKEAVRLQYFIARLRQALKDGEVEHFQFAPQEYPSDDVPYGKYRWYYSMRVDQFFKDTKTPGFIDGIPFKKLRKCRTRLTFKGDKKSINHLNMKEWK